MFADHFSDYITPKLLKGTIVGFLSAPRLFFYITNSTASSGVGGATVGGETDANTYTTPAHTHAFNANGGDGECAVRQWVRPGQSVRTEARYYTSDSEHITSASAVLKERRK